MCLYCTAMTQYVSVALMRSDILWKYMCMIIVDELNYYRMICMTITK